MAAPSDDRSSAEIDTRVVQAYVKLIESEQREASNAYVAEILKLKDGNPCAMSKEDAAAAQRSAVRSPSAGHREHAKCNWSTAVLHPSGESALRVAKHCTAVFLDVHKHVETLRARVAVLSKLFAEQATSATSVGAALRNATRLAESQRHSPADIIDSVFAASTAAVERLRDGVLYTSTVLNAEVASIEAHKQLCVIQKLMLEEALQHVSTYATSKERAARRDADSGVHHLSCESAAALLQQVPLDGPRVLSWQASVLPSSISWKGQPVAEANTHQIMSSDRDIAEKRLVQPLSHLKAAAAHRVLEHSRHLVETHDVAVPTSAAKKIVVPVRPAGSASTARLTRGSSARTELVAPRQESNPPSPRQKLGVLQGEQLFVPRAR